MMLTEVVTPDLSRSSPETSPSGGLVSLGYLVFVWAPIDLIDWILERFQKPDE